MGGIGYEGVAPAEIVPRKWSRGENRHGRKIGRVTREDNSRAKWRNQEGDGLVVGRVVLFGGGDNGLKIEQGS